MEALFPTFTGRRPERRESWSWGPSRREKKKVEIIEAELQKLVRRDLDGVRVLHALYRRWRRGRGRCGGTVARQTPIVRRWRSCRTMRSGVTSTWCCS